MRTFTVKSALGRSGLRNWSECTQAIIFVCAVSLRSNSECEDVHLLCTLPSMAIVPIEEAADILIVPVEDSESDGSDHE
jgi:hypothetical protein